MLSKALLSAALAVSAGASAAGARPDPKAPTITDLTYPDAVSTESVFIVSFTASDPLGVDHVTFSAYPQQGWWFPCSDAKQFTLVNGTAFEGTWQAECPVPAGTPDQVYSFNYNAVDTEGHSATETFKHGFEVTGGPEAEYEPPTIEKISVAETVTAGTMLDVYLTVSDESGIETSRSYVNVHQTDGHFSPCASDELVLQSGSSTDGVFKASCLLPAGTPNGDYWLEVHMYDTQMNPAEQNVDNAFEVVGGAAPDYTPPAVTGMQYADNTVTRGQTLSVTVTVSDQGTDQSGIDYVNFQAKESYLQTFMCGGAMVLQSGDKASGVWAFSCEVPEEASIDYYTGSVYAFDNQNNEAMWSEGFSVVMA
jgi:hypothetical protein